MYYQEYNENKFDLSLTQRRNEFWRYIPGTCVKSIHNFNFEPLYEAQNIDVKFALSNKNPICWEYCIITYLKISNRLIGTFYQKTLEIYKELEFE